MANVEIKTEIIEEEQPLLDDKTEPETNVHSVEIKTEPDDDVIQVVVATRDEADKKNKQCSSSEAIVDSVLKSEIDIEPTQLEEPCEKYEQSCSSDKTLKIVHISREDIEPTIVGEPTKLYDIQRLRNFGNVPFVIKRMEPQDFSITYTKAVSSVETILEQLRRNQVPNGIGIALRIANHTPSSCLLILSILNHKCHFYSNDKLILSKALHWQMCCAGIDYLIVNGYMPVGAVYFEYLDSFLVFNEEYKLFKLKHTSKDPPIEAKAPLPANMCYTITTTGTTGTPKLIHVPYECIAPNIVALSQKLNISMADVIYLGTPCTFDPSIVELFLALQNGSAVLISHYTMRESPKRVLSALFPTSITTPGITVLQMTPSLFRQFGASAIRERILSSSSSLRVLLLGGEPFPSNVELATWMEPQILLQKHICNVYGITEISCWSMMHVLKSLHSRVPLGTPIDDQTVLAVHYENKQKEGCGELYLGSVTRRCYIPQVDDMDKKNASICYRATGDLVRRFDDGSIFYEERANDVVKRAGTRISLGLITRKIEKCLHSSELAACLWQEELQKLICCIRCFEPKTKVQQRAQTFDILSKLACAEQPDRFVYLQHFPCDAHGKLDKKLLLKECTLLAQPAQDILKSFLHDRLECVDTLNERFAKKQRLDINATNNPSGYDLSFRQAGGTSFHAITLCREIGLQMCIDDEQRHLFELLLDENVPLRVVLSFLDTAKLVTHNTKLKPVEPPLDAIPAATPSCSRACGLVITRVEQPAIHFQYHWKVNFSKCVDSPVAQYEGRYVAVGAHSKILRTLDALTGQEQSTLRLPDRIECKVTFLSEQLAMVGCYDGCLYGFNPLTGEMVWNIDIGGMIKAQPFLSEDGARIVICSYAEDYNVMCLSTERQQVLWCMRIGEKAIFASPLELPRQQAIIICTLDGGYTRVSLLDGSVQWAKKCKQPMFASPVLLDPNTFACAEVNGQVHACNVNSGKILDSYAAEGNIFSALVVRSPPTHMGHTFVLFGCIDHHVYCLRCKTTAGKSASFELHWKVDVGASVYATPTILKIEPNGFLVFCCATDGRVVLANLSNGQIQWSDKLPGELFSTPCYIESLRRIYLGCRDNYLYCLGI
ncbi:beta-alanine-activating enzyme isoform X1 [Drosophila sulfurigaster albostrigata]|uniref:beta-alanine-activating enzyme isoform X1 n=1 Tax=Drosophila sulfurigaster albostrigata TaxID=89887 RepID=UPI002D21B7D4|nr:beta-alanine-activating enzyme isoform X1 [Drosophila sulfurigaster albostrigata]